MYFIKRSITLQDLLTRWDCPLEYVLSLTEWVIDPDLQCYRVHSVRKDGSGCFVECFNRPTPFDVQCGEYDLVFDLDEVERLENGAQLNAEGLKTKTRSFWQYVHNCEQTGMSDAQIAKELKDNGFSEPAIAMLLHKGELTLDATKKAFQRLKENSPGIFQK